MIDVLCTAVLRDGEKLYQHFKTIDTPIKRYFIIDNSCDQDESVKKALEKIQSSSCPYVGEVLVLKTVQNTGYPGAVNLSIKQNTDCNHWLFTGFDWYPEPGEFKKLSDEINKQFFGATLGIGNDEMCGIVLTPRLIAMVGLMDENFYPGYFEDNDYRYRQKLAGIKMASFPLKNKHYTSSTLNSCEEFKQKNHITFASNLQYYVKKWGGPPGNECYKSPFNKGYPISYWSYDPKRINNLRWV